MLQKSLTSPRYALRDTDQLTRLSECSYQQQGKGASEFRCFADHPVGVPIYGLQGRASMAAPVRPDKPLRGGV
jgi:hypothetical protein